MQMEQWTSGKLVHSKIEVDQYLILLEMYYFYSAHAVYYYVIYTIESLEIQSCPLYIV